MDASKITVRSPDLRGDMRKNPPLDRKLNQNTYCISGRPDFQAVTMFPHDEDIADIKS